MREYTQEQKKAMQRYNKRFIDELNRRDIVQALGLQKDRKGGRDGYICPICGSGTGKNGTGGTVTRDHRRYTCWMPDCPMNGDGHGQDVYGGLQAITGKKGNDILRENFPSYNIVEALNGVEAAVRPDTQERQERTTERTERRTGAAEGHTEAAADYTSYYRACRSRINDPAAKAYLTFRGISEGTASRYWLGFDPAADPANAPGAMGDEYKPHPCPRLIIPFDAQHYMGRRIDKEAKFKAMNSAKQGDDDGVPPFNLKAIYNDAARPTFITESAIDALSVIEAGGEAVGLNSASNTRKLLEQIRKKRTSSTLILCLDSDDAGRKATASLADGLRELNIPFVTADICAGHKDPNESLTANRAAFVEAVGIAERKTARPDNAGDYIRQQMAGEIAALKQYAERKTGFPNLDDQAGGIYPGLYILAGTSSVGKTTLLHQICDQMAMNGQHVLFFSMEQSRLEMVSKSISRLTAIMDAETAVTSIQIRRGYLPARVLDAADGYINNIVGDRLSVIEGNFSCNASFIGEYTRNYIKNNGVKPIVAVDYLQVVQPEADPETGRKPTDARSITDYNVTAFKRMSRTLEIPVFVISSVNRSNYLTPIDFESLKESGGIEFTADVVWGLQLSAIHDPIFDKEGGVKAKREKIAQAKEAIPRAVELVCLKNRYGKSRYSVSFNYYPQFDYFVPCYDDDPYKPVRKL